MIKSVVVLMTLLGTAFAQIDRTCIDITFNPATPSISGKCQPRDNSGYIPSTLDLNDCFGYDGTNITASHSRPTKDGNFAESCHDCELFKAPDPYFGGLQYWIRCTCEGQSGKVAASIEDAYAHEYVANKNGHLTCGPEPF
ncbi:CVNH domain protein [Fusarium beomiforme]|uniref:CVNH domain protein n=1 Tax=Fusarium beomiforme TaxID=44412 RepID=A0A9P5E0W7_9HYPO|nr:CVNH domain protein [Fusarium beomiforme]